MMKSTIPLVLGALGTAAFVVRQKVRLAEPLAYKPGLGAPVPARLQHAVYYVRDLERSRLFYQDIFDLQFSARNHVAVEAISFYWHFVDVVWIALFSILYFLR